MRGLAHPGGPLAPHDLWAAWNDEPFLLLSLALAGMVYLWGTHNVWARAGRGHGILVWRLFCFVGAILALVIALVSPLDAMSGVLFSAHMAQHLLLILVAAPLLVLSDVPLVILWVIPRTLSHALSRRMHQSRMISRVWAWVTSPVFGWLSFTLALWIWHALLVYEAALRSEAVHVIEHVGFLGIAVLFWWVLFKHTQPNHLHYAIAMVYLFASAMQSGILGALMTFTSQPWYPYYAPLVISWGLTPLQDQQLAGLLMWLPGGVVFTLLTIGYFARWFRALEKRSMQLRLNDSNELILQAREHS